MADGRTGEQGSALTARALIALFLVTWLCSVGAGLPQFLEAAAQSPATEWASFGLIVLSAAVMIWDLARRRTWVPAVVAFVTLSAAVAVIGAWGAPPPENNWWPETFAIHGAGYLLLRFGARAWVVLVGTLLLLQPLAWSWGHEGIANRPRMLLDRALANWGLLAVATGIWFTAQLILRLVDGLRQPDVTASGLAAQVADDVDRSVHDRVMPVLRVLAAEPSDSDRHDVRALVEPLLADIRRADEAAANEPWLVVPKLKAAAPPGLSVRWQVRAHPVGPPHGVRRLAAAVGELLRNVERHSGVDSAVVRIDAPQGIDSVRVRVSDKGRGFDPDVVLARRGGLVRSVTDRVKEIGGEVQVSSHPGRGTTVTLVWAPDRPDVAQVSSRVRRAFLLMTSALPLLTVLQTPLLWPWLSQPWVALGLSILLASLSLGVALRNPSGLTPWQSAGLQALGVVIVAAYCLCVPHGVETTLFFVIVSPAAAMSIQTMLIRPPREGLIGIFGICAAAALVAVPRLQGGWNHPGALTLVAGPLLGGFISMASRYYLDHVWQRMRALKEANLTAGSVEAHQKQVAAGVVARLTEVDRDFVEHLESTIEGTVDERHRAWARRTEMSLRDGLEMPTAVRARRALVHMRELDVQARASVPPDVPDEVDRELEALVAQGLSRWDAPTERTVAVMSAMPMLGRWTCSLILRELDADGRVSGDEDDELALRSTVTPAPGGGPEPVAVFTRSGHEPSSHPSSEELPTSPSRPDTRE